MAAWVEARPPVPSLQRLSRSLASTRYAPYKRPSSLLAHHLRSPVLRRMLSAVSQCCGLSEDDEYDPGSPRVPLIMDGERDSRAREAIEAEGQPESKRARPQGRTHSFKAVGHMVMAMRRFQASLNPTYTYGKRPSTSTSAQSSASVGDADDSGASHAPPSPVRYVYPARGHKVDLLFAPLPSVPQPDARDGVDASKPDEDEGRARDANPGSTAAANGGEA